MTGTYTFALLELSPEAYQEIRDKLTAAGYEHAFEADGTIDMHGLAVRPSNQERYAACINCGYIMEWKAHKRLSEAQHCPRCGKQDQFGPGVYVEGFEGYTLAQVMRRA